VHERYRRQTTDDRQTDGRAIAYSEREREFTFAKNYGNLSTALVYILTTRRVPGYPVSYPVGYPGNELLVNGSRSPSHHPASLPFTYLRHDWPQVGVAAWRRLLTFESREMEKYKLEKVIYEITGSMYIHMASDTRLYRSTTYVDEAYCYRPISVVCRSVTVVSPAKSGL